MVVFVHLAHVVVVTASPGCSGSSLERQQERLLERFDDPAQEADAVGAVDHPVIVGQRQRQHEPRRELPLSLL